MDDLSGAAQTLLRAHKGLTAIRELSEMGGEKALKEIAGEVAELVGKGL